LNPLYAVPGHTEIEGNAENNPYGKESSMEGKYYLIKKQMEAEKMKDKMVKIERPIGFKEDKIYGVNPSVTKNVEFLEKENEATSNRP
jgi:hypothetical protein